MTSEMIRPLKLEDWKLAALIGEKGTPFCKDWGRFGLYVGLKWGRVSVGVLVTGSDCPTYFNVNERMWGVKNIDLALYVLRCVMDAQRRLILKQAVVRLTKERPGVESDTLPNIEDLDDRAGKGLIIPWRLVTDPDQYRN